ncbi:MFS transporter [Streptomyces cheonanensis]|uniref:MFS transporter n=1 Tax=Streptomyces cheonanensis TaxID=312720 RepID=A0ABN2VN49_9ACTN
MDLATRRRRRSLFLLFLLPGLSISSWVTRTPDIRDALGASTGQMGLILFGLSVGSMLGILSSGALVARYGTRPVVGLGTVLVVVSLVTIGMGTLSGAAPLVTLGLALFGAGMGSGEVALNVEGAEIERITGRAVLPALHGFFSLGTAIGATLGIVCTATRLPVQWHLLAVASVAAVILIGAFGGIPAGVGRREAAGPGTADGGAGAASPVWRDTRLLLIGGVVLAMALAEGAANDWLPLLMVDGHGLDASLGSVMYAGFAAAMATGRFSGTVLVNRFGRATVMRASAVSGAAGLALVIFAGNPVLAGCAVLLWGLGASLGFPLALSAAGESGPNPAARVSLASIIGYTAFLVGPPGLGFLGEHYGLRGAMVVVLVCVIGAIFLAPAVGSRPGPRDGERAGGDGDAAVPQAAPEAPTQAAPEAGEAAGGRRPAP